VRRGTWSSSRNVPSSTISATTAVYTTKNTALNAYNRFITPSPQTAALPVAATMPARTSRVPSAAGAALAAALVIALGACVHAIIPLRAGGALVIVFVWAALPGVIIARRLYGTWAPALLTGPVWGFAVSSAVLLAMWIAGVRSMSALAASPAIAMAAAVPCGRL